MTLEEKDAIAVLNARIVLKAKKLETVASELTSLLSEFESRDGWQHCVDDDDEPFNSMTDYISRGLSINPSLIEA